MPLEVILVFAILTVAVVLFLTGWMRMDLVAFLVLGSLAVTGLVTPHQALQGFSNPAVITVWSMFILSAAFSFTGLARMIGQQMYALAGKSEWRVIMVIMLISGLLSSVMNNIGVAALMLPVVMDISRSTGHPPARLLLPLAISTHLGGLTTLIGNPSNIVVSVALADAGETPFRLLDFTPIGITIMLAGTLMVALLTRKLLPASKGQSISNKLKFDDLSNSYHLEDRIFTVTIPENSALSGLTLAESRLRPALGINVISIKREGGGTILNPEPETVLRHHDKLMVQGRFEAVNALKRWRFLLPEQMGTLAETISLEQLNLFEVIIAHESPLKGKTIYSIYHDVTLVAIRKDGQTITKGLRNMTFSGGDMLLVQAAPEKLQDWKEQKIVAEFRTVAPEKLQFLYRIHETLFYISIEESSELFEKTHSNNQLAETFGLRPLAIVEKNGRVRIPQMSETLALGTTLLVSGNRSDLSILKSYKTLVIDESHSMAQSNLEADDVIMAEVVLAPRSAIAGKTLREINFRKKFGLSVLALWRDGRAYRTNIHNLQLRFGEALLIYGKRDKIAILGNDPDFILLTDTMSKPMRLKKAPWAIIVIVAVLAPVVTGWLPIELTSVVGVALMVLTGCLTMEEAYQSIHWRSVFLIAGMLPLGIALQETGAAALLAGKLALLEPWTGVFGVVAGLYLLAMLLSLALHPAALAVILAPVAMQMAEIFNLSPQSLMMFVAIASMSLLSPVSHPANLLIMAPGGYKFSDFVKFGLPLALFIMLIALFLVPVFWPL